MKILIPKTAPAALNNPEHQNGNHTYDSLYTIQKKQARTREPVLLGGLNNNLKPLEALEHLEHQELLEA